MSLSNILRHEFVTHMSHDNSVHFPDGGAGMRIVCISDTHGFHREMVHPVPAGDVLVHAGDFIRGDNSEAETRDFGKWLGEQPHTLKIVVAGNHDVGFEREPEKFRKLLHNCHYLENSWLTFAGVKFYGAPQTPEFMNWAFNVPRGEAIAKYWRRIPSDTQVLVTHGPAFGKLDTSRRGTLHLGDEDLAAWLGRTRCRVKLHIFGHIHGGYGQIEDSRLVRVNAAVCSEAYRPVNKPIVVDI